MVSFEGELQGSVVHTSEEPNPCEAIARFSSCTRLQGPRKSHWLSLGIASWGQGVQSDTQVRKEVRDIQTDGS